MGGTGQGQQDRRSAQIKGGNLVKVQQGLSCATFLYAWNSRGKNLFADLALIKKIRVPHLLTYDVVVRLCFSSS